MKPVVKIGILEFATVLGSMSAPALAQEDVSGDRIEEIVVTAQKRAESVQDVPIAISAFSGTALTERAIGNVAQLSAGTPNVNLDASSTFSGSSAVLTAYIRGIGLNDFGIQLDPGVGVYLDGIYLARTIGANLDLPDIQRIEILKGPQGTLFGRNTIGGAISVVTRDPGDRLAFRGDVTTGRFGRLDVRGSADLPLTEQLSAMVTFSAKNRDGYQKRNPFPGLQQYRTEAITAFRNTGYGAADEAGDQDEWTLRGKLVWRPSSRMTVRLSGDYQRIDQAATPNSLLLVTNEISGPFAGTMNIPGTALDPTGTTGFNFAGLYNFCIGFTPGEIAARGAQNLCGPRGTPLNPSEILPGLGSVNVDGDPTNDRLPFDGRWVNADKDTSYATGVNFSRLESWGLAGTIDYELNDNIDLRSITGYRDIDFKSGVDFDNSPLAMLENTIAARQWQISQEVQILGTALDKKLNYVLGGYFFKEKGSAIDYITFGEGLLQIETPVDIQTTNYAIFGQIDARITDFIGITVGGRYTHEKKHLRASISDLNGLNYKLFNCVIYGDPCSTGLGFPNPGDPLEFYVPDTQHKTFSNFSPKVGIQLHPTDNVMIYGSWSQGYKTGGWTTRITSPLPFAPDYDEEEAETWEVGFKSTLFDRRLQFNAAAFTNKYKGIQLNFQEGVSPILQNAGDARIKGFEVEAVAVPAQGLTINGAIGYLDATYLNVLPQAQVAANPLQAGVFAGAQLPKNPKWKFSVSPRYELTLPSDAAIVFLADYSWTSKLWSDPERTYLIRREATGIVNASITFKAPSNWDLTIGATNLTNERYLVSGLAQIVGGAIAGSWSRPAEWYARLGVNF